MRLKFAAASSPTCSISERLCYNARMESEARWRLISDYIGAGRFVVEPERVIVGTPNGVECVPRPTNPKGDGWRVDFGSRCMGVQSFADGAILASCRGGLLLLTGEGEEQREKVFAEQLVHEVVPLDASRPDGHSELLIAAGTTLALYRNWEPVWRYSFHDALGASVESVRLVNLFPCGDAVVAGAVDYDSGVGRVVALGRDGKSRWLSDPGPVSEVFPAGEDRFVWCLTGYGKFETHATAVDGSALWSLEGAGVGARKPGGSLALITGSNESPEWDHWECRQIDADGQVEFALRARGRAPVRPYCHEDGTIYFVGYVLHIDPSSSRVDYTNFFAMPQELHYQHLVGLRKQIPEYEICLQKVRPEHNEVELVHRIQGSYSLAEPNVIGDEVIFCDGPDIVAFPR